MAESLSCRELFNCYWDYIILDTRTEEEYSKSHLGPAANLCNVPEAWETIANFCPEKRDKIILYSGSDTASKHILRQVVAILKENEHKLKKALRSHNCPQICRLEVDYPQLSKQFPFLCTPQYSGDIVYPTMVTENLFISAKQCAHDERVINQLRIGSIVNCTQDVKNLFEDTVKYHRIPIDDSESEDILDQIPSALNFIEENLPGGVLVHCQRGQSRSASIVIAYLMKKNKWNCVTALEHLKQARPACGPNTGFLRQLRFFEESFL